MNIKTGEDLYSFLSQELAWRKKELHSLLTLVEVDSTTYTGGKKNVILRGAVAMLYAHWEGFIKSSSNAYLEFVSWQKLPNKELTYNFIALSARRILQDAALSTKIKSHIAVTEFFMEKIGNKSSIPTKNVINTKSNLTSSVLKEIIEVLDFDYSFYAPKEKLIDDKLVNSRNNIAHGNYLQIDQKEFTELYEQVLEMMSYFSTQIDNAATLKIYSKKK